MHFLNPNRTLLASKVLLSSKVWSPQENLVTVKESDILLLRLSGDVMRC